jgi:riboflavin kinase/FMN adenylyltransferase
MDIVHGHHNLRARHRGCVLTVGNFDGVHRGHQALLKQARERAAELKLPLAVLTFEPTPREFFDPQNAPARVLTFRSRVGLLKEQGVDTLLLQNFDHRFAAITAQQFVEQLLVEKLGIRAIIVGDDFRFGAKRVGDLALLQKLGQQHGFTTDRLDTIAVQGVRCSSTALRESLAQADLKRVADILGRRYALRGHVRRGLQLGRTLGMPTTNIYFHRPLAIKQGIYAVRAVVKDQIWDGVASLGVRPTLGFTRCLLETHLFGEPGELYGQVMDVEFHHYLRAELKFDSLDALSVQMQRDASDARAYFGENTST